MQANELKIGNLINSKLLGSNHTVRGFLKKADGSIILYTDLQESYSDLNDWQPIPLTPEILGKAGFTIGASNGNKAYYHKSIGFDDFCICIYRDTNNVYFCLGNEENSAFEPKKYVHQLQNMVHSLTGEELILNL